MSFNRNNGYICPKTVFLPLIRQQTCIFVMHRTSWLGFSTDIQPGCGFPLGFGLGWFSIGQGITGLKDCSLPGWQIEPKSEPRLSPSPGANINKQRKSWKVSRAFCSCQSFHPHNSKVGSDHTIRPKPLRKCAITGSLNFGLWFQFQNRLGP